MDFSPGDIAYAAFTDAVTFMLDADGICRWTVTRPGARGSADAAIAERCVGAQYVASLDFETKGGLAELPRPGCPLLFAKLDERGRISLVRTGPLTRFEDRAAAREARTLSPRESDSGVHERPTQRSSSAPPAAASAPPAPSSVPEIDDYADQSATMRLSPAVIAKVMNKVAPSEAAGDPLAKTMRAPDPLANAFGKTMRASEPPVNPFGKTSLADLEPRRGVLPRRRPKGAAPLPPPPRVHATKALAADPAPASSGVLPRDDQDESDPHLASQAARGR